MCICFDEESGRYYIKKAADLKKDQSYVLWRLTQDQISMLTFPLALREKKDVRAEALEQNLPSADAEESQEICFIPTNDYISYIGYNLQSYIVAIKRPQCSSSRQ